MAQVVGRPLCKCEALKIKNPRPTQKKKKKKKPLKRADGVAEDVGPEFQPQYCERERERERERDSSTVRGRERDSLCGLG
jgi:hypothetical protein